MGVTAAAARSTNHAHLTFSRFAKWEKMAACRCSLPSTPVYTRTLWVMSVHCLWLFREELSEMCQPVSGPLLLGPSWPLPVLAIEL